MTQTARAAHTPGPWLIEWSAAQGGDGHHITDSKDMGELSRVATVLFHDDAYGETRANATLLAAAPDLLAALKRLVDQVDAGYSADYAALQGTQIMRNARAAIASATGEAA